MEPVAQKRLVKMSKSLKLRALLYERLTAVAEEIFQLFQSTIAEYEEELLGANDDGNVRQTQPLEPAMEESEATRRPGIQILSSCQREASPVTQENLVQICIKEEPDQRIKDEEESLPFTLVSVKVDEDDASPVYQQTVDKMIEITDFDIDTSAQVGIPANSSILLFSIATNDAPETFDSSNDVSSATNEGETHLADPPVTDPEPKQHKCGQCGKEYQHSSSLFRHFVTHREQKPFRCSVCQRGFSQKPHLTRHMMIHTGEKPFGCPFCAWTFSTKTNLGKHLRIHTGEKTFACAVCNVRFGCLKTLTTHKRMHAGDRPFACKECNVIFKQQASLYSHMRTHSGEKPYSCSICEKSFWLRRSLREHLRKVHAGQETPSGGEAEVDCMSKTLPI